MRKHDRIIPASENRTDFGNRHSLITNDKISQGIQFSPNPEIWSKNKLLAQEIGNMKNKVAPLLGSDQGICRAALLNGVWIKIGACVVGDRGGEGRGEGGRYTLNY